MARKAKDDSAMVKIRKLFEKSEMTMAELGEKMGYTEDIARQSVFQFLKTADPRISMLRKAADALGVELKDLL